MEELLNLIGCIGCICSCRRTGVVFEIVIIRSVEVVDEVIPSFLGRWLFAPFFTFSIEETGVLYTLVTPAD